MEKTKTKNCQNCKTEFRIDPEDFEFYKKVEVPEPTFCPDCRLQRRMAWRKESPIFYKSKCQATSKDLISVYNPNGPIRIYDQKYWFSDEWDPLEFGKEYDFKKTFFEQFAEILYSAPQPEVINDSVEESSYCHECNWLKGCYLVTNSGKGEDLAYCNRTVETKDSLDLYITNKSELCYETTYCNNSYKLFFSDHCDDCVESFFLYDCKHCENCFGCTNLRHKKYHIFNKEYSKEEYFKKLKSFDLDSYKTLVKTKEKHHELYLKAIHRFANIIKSPDSTGNELVNSKNCRNCFDVQDCENMKYVNWAGFGYPVKDTYDGGPGVAAGELIYESIGTGLGGMNKFMFFSMFNHHTEYSYNIRNSEYIFGCAGLRHKKYCILNKQYTKEEYNELLPRIKQHMNDMPYTDKKGNVYKYGEFFPTELSPYGYDESIAQEFFPLSVQEIEKNNYANFERPKNEYEVTMKASELPDGTRDVDDSVLKEVIECGNGASGECLGSGVFRLIPQELEFYKKYNLPLPRLCPICRHGERTKKRSPLRLYEGRCMCDGKIHKNKTDHSHGDNACENTFETTYSPDREEIVYCKECYQKEVE